MTNPLLAIETSGRHGSIALADWHEGAFEVLQHVDLPTTGRTAALLHPAIDNLLKYHKCKPSDLAIVAVAVGPGSFTGLRIGLTTAKTLAYAIDTKVVAVSTLDTLAAASGRSGRVWAVLNAQRGEYFVAGFERDEQLPRAKNEYQILSPSQLAAQVREGDKIVGPPASKLVTECGRDVTAIDLAPSASEVARLASIRAGQRDFDDLWELVPDYGRLSAAEEKANADS